MTTWQLLARGISTDAKVGEGISQVVTTKPLLVRPVTPRFVVAGDQVQLAAVVHNNTDGQIEVVAGLTVSGFVLADPASAQQTVTLPAGGSARARCRCSVTARSRFFGATARSMVKEPQSASIDSPAST